MTLSRIEKNSFLFERLQFFFSPTSDSLSPKDFVETKKTSSFERKPLICFGVSQRQLNRFSATTLQLPSKINFTTFKFFLLCNLIFFSPPPLVEISTQAIRTKEEEVEGSLVSGKSSGTHT